MPPRPQQRERDHGEAQEPQQNNRGNPQRQPRLHESLGDGDLLWKGLGHQSTSAVTAVPPSTSRSVSIPPRIIAAPNNIRPTPGPICINPNATFAPANKTMPIRSTGTTTFLAI